MRVRLLPAIPLYAFHKSSLSKETASMLQGSLLSSTEKSLPCTGMKLIETIGLYDTGNRLYEPIRKKPVSIIGKELAMRLLEGEQEWGRRFRLIPYSSIGVENGLMKGFVADELVVFVNRYSFVYAHPVLAVAEQSFGKRDGYEIILHPDMI